MATPAYYSQEQFSVTVTVGEPGTDSFLDLGKFSSRDGGEFDSDTVPVYPGGMSPAVVRPGRKTVSDITVGRDFAFGDAALMASLAPRVGRVVARCTSQPLDGDGHPYGRGFVWTGILKGLVTPTHDASSTDNTRWSITIMPTTTLGSVNT